MTTTNLPAVIDAYQRAHDEHDSVAALATFDPDVTVIDDGVTYSGSEEVRGWLADVASEYTYTRTLSGVDDLGDGVYVVYNHLAGDFPGGEVDLRYRFQLRDGLIHHLEIAP